MKTGFQGLEKYRPESSAQPLRRDHLPISEKNNMHLLRYIIGFTICTLLFGCGEKLEYQRYGFTEETVLFPNSQIQISLLPSFERDDQDPNKGTFGSPYTLRIAFLVSSSNQLSFVDFKTMRFAGEDSKITVELGSYQIKKIHNSLNSETTDMYEAVAIIPISDESKLHYESIELSGLIDVKRNDGTSFLETDFSVLLKTDYKEEKKSKRLAQILGI